MIRSIINFSIPNLDNMLVTHILLLGFSSNLHVCVEPVKPDYNRTDTLEGSFPHYCSVSVCLSHTVSLLPLNDWVQSCSRTHKIHLLCCWCHILEKPSGPWILLNAILTRGLVIVRGFNAVAHEKLSWTVMLVWQLQKKWLKWRLVLFIYSFDRDRAC